MFKYFDSVDIWTDDILNQGLSDQRIKDALLFAFEDSFGADTDSLTTIISDMKDLFPDKNQSKDFEDMLYKDFQPYLNFMNIDRGTFRIDERDENYSTVTFEFSFDLEKAVKKAEKCFKNLPKTSGNSR